jgi:hypothetical protein
MVFGDRSDKQAGEFGNAHFDDDESRGGKVTRDEKGSRRSTVPGDSGQSRLRFKCFQVQPVTY